MSIMMHTEYFSPGETCKILNVTRSVLRRLGNSGKIKYFELPSGQRRYRVDYDYVVAKRHKAEESRSEVSIRQDTDPVRCMLVAAKSRARSKGVDFNLEPEDISIPEKCPVLGIPISVGQRRQSYSSPSLDRIVPKNGYTKGNVRVISWRANRLKYDSASPAELRAIADYIEANT